LQRILNREDGLGNLQLTRKAGQISADGFKVATRLFFHTSPEHIHRTG